MTQACSSKLKTLFTLCLEFVASSIHQVESFDGFPDTIGKQIFQESVRRNEFRAKHGSITTTAKEKLKIFFDAYANSGILNHLSLQRSHLFVNDTIIECPWILQNLTCLDLSFCGLGDSHELLPQLVSLDRLQVLNLQGNSLSDYGIRLLTTPLRFHSKLHSLKYFDLSCNSVTTNILHYLKNFSLLMVIDVSGTNFNKKISSKAFTLLSPDCCSCWEYLCHVATDGWAKEVLDGWKEEYQNFINPAVDAMEDTPSKTSLTALNAKTFYRRRKPASMTHDVLPTEKTKAVDRLILVTDHFYCSKEYSCENTSNFIHSELMQRSANHPVESPIQKALESCSSYSYKKRISRDSLEKAFSTQAEKSDNNLRLKRKISEVTSSQKNTVTKHKSVQQSNGVSSMTADCDFDVLSLYTNINRGNSVPSVKRYKSITEISDDMF